MPFYFSNSGLNITRDRIKALMVFLRLNLSLNSFNIVPTNTKILIVSLIILLLDGLVSPTVTAQDPSLLENLLADMTVMEKVGQLFLVPFEGNNADSNSDINILITKYKVGGVVIQSSNGNFVNNDNTPKEIAMLTNKLQAQTSDNKNIPLFIAVDHEGDDLPFTRIRGGATSIPSPMSIGATWNMDNAQAIGRIVGQELSAMGINLLLGPVVDVLNNPHPTGRGDIGIRSFGGDPFWVGEMGQVYIQGVHEGSNNKIATVAKHFPGHGGSDRLPDNEVATVDKSLQGLRRIELVPFFEVTDLSRPGITDMMMSGHIRYRGFQGGFRQVTAPISFDEQSMTILLDLPEFRPWRKQGGLIISDALGVPAVQKYYDPTLQTFPHRRVAYEAFIAGNDILILSQFALNGMWSNQFENIKDTIEYFETEYEQNEAFAKRVDTSVTRILRLKLKLFPSLSPNAFLVDEEVALFVSGQGEQISQQIAQQSLTLLYPTPAEYSLRIQRPPDVNEKILIVSDTRQVKECYQVTCQPFETLSKNALKNIIIQLYGPDTTARVRPENITSITFSELKNVLVGTLAIADEIKETPSETSSSDNPDGDESEEISTHQKITTLIQEADWIIFAMLDLNTSRFPDSDALKLFLAQGLTSLYNKNLIVFAFNSPYYLDTTEVNKLTAYFALYSKTSPHLEVAVRTLFDKISPMGASPVNVEGIGYDLASILVADPILSFPVQVQSISPESLLPPVSVILRVGPILDHNGNIVPDGTPVEFDIMYTDKRIISIPPETTIEGVVETTIILTEPGTVELFTRSGQAKSHRPQIVSVAAPPNTPTPIPTATDTPSPIVSVTSVPTATVVITDETQEGMSRHVDGGDLFITMITIFMATIIGTNMWQHTYRTPSERTRLALVIFIGGTIAYLLYGLGWFRPEIWLMPESSITIQRMTLSGLVFAFGLIGSFLEYRVRRQIDS